MQVDSRSFGAAIPAPEPALRGSASPAEEPAVVVSGWNRGTGTTPMGLDSDVALWETRWQTWRNAFASEIAPRVKRYHRMWRAFDDMPSYGPGQEWRDRTVVPEAFKIIETRLPAVVLTQYAGRNWFTCEGVQGKDVEFEESVKALIQSSIDEVGKAERERGPFIKRMIDGHRYREIMGHVFFKVWWRSEKSWIKTKQRTPEGRWEQVEKEVLVYDGVDVDWLPLDRIAIDLSGGRRWIIERVRTSVEELVEQDAAYFRDTGERLYDASALQQLTERRAGGGQDSQEPLEEPDDTEGWPLDSEMTTGDPLSTPVELWLCWDNTRRTLTKIADRTLVLDKGLAPTPTGRDPYISSPSVAIPGQVYGDSILQWVGSLIDYQTKIVRARGDEILLNIFNQHIVKAGTILSTQFYFEPGGVLEITDDGSGTPVKDYIQVLDRRPVFTEAWSEEQARRAEAEATAGADALQQGDQATSKSRDVTRAEVEQRTRAASGRQQLQTIYDEMSTKAQILGAIYDLLRQNLTTPRIVRVLDRDLQMDLRDLERPVDIKVGGGLYEIAKAERSGQIERLTNYAQVPVFQPYMKPDELLKEVLKIDDWKQPERFVRSKEEVMAEQARTLAAQGGGAGPGSTGAAGGVAAPGGDIAGAAGPGPEADAFESGPLVETIE